MKNKAMDVILKNLHKTHNSSSKDSLFCGKQ